MSKSVYLDGMEVLREVVRVSGDQEGSKEEWKVEVCVGEEEELYKSKRGFVP